MKKTILVIGILFLMLGTANATVISVNSEVSEFRKWDPYNESYTMPAALDTYQSQEDLMLSHGVFYYWWLNDISYAAGSGAQVDIVFQNLRNYANEPGNVINLYVDDYDGPKRTDVLGINSDNQSLDEPDWSSWTHLGSWSYDEVYPGYYDVVFSITDPNVLAFLSDGDGWLLGIDPDCAYTVGEITINAPVPEPATMLLLGAGLAGMAVIRRRKSTKA